MPKRLRTLQGKLKVQHSILPGLREALETLLKQQPQIKSIIPGEIRPVRNARGKVKIRVTVPTATGWKAIGFDQGARQELFITTALSRQKLETAISKALESL